MFALAVGILGKTKQTYSKFPPIGHRTRSGPCAAGEDGKGDTEREKRKMKQEEDLWRGD